MPGLPSVHDAREAAGRDRLVALVYGDLRRMGARALRTERADISLQPADLVHLAYQRLLAQKRTHWRDRPHFVAIVAGLMRRILVDHARKGRALRRGGGAVRRHLDEADAEIAASPAFDRLALDDALAELASHDPDLARLVMLRYSCGLTVVETAKAMGVSRATVLRNWSLARGWLRRRLSAPEEAR